MYFQLYGYQLHKQCVSAGWIMWRKWDLRGHCTNCNLTSYQKAELFVVVLLVSCYLHVTSEPRATHMPVFYGAKWMSGAVMWADSQNSHASSVMANYNWQQMLESGQAQTEVSWQNNPDHHHVHWKLNITLQSTHTLRSGPAIAHAIPPRISMGLSLSHRAQCCSCYQGVSQ